jgi:hypothetical protein
VIEQDDVDVVVLAVHGIEGESVTTDLVKSGVVYGSHVQLFDPALSLISSLGNSGVDLADFVTSGDQEQAASLAQSLVALDDLDIDTLSGLAERGLVSLLEPIAKEEIGTGRSVELFLQRFAELVNGPRHFVMLDRYAGRVFSELRSTGDFVVEPGATRRSHEASTANGLLGHVPNFRTASLEEVLGIRESLSDALPRFRSGVAEVAATFDTDIDAVATFDEIDEAWRSVVAPAIVEIEELTNESRFLRSLLSSGLSDGSAIAGSGIGIITAMTSELEGVGGAISTLIGASIGVASSAVREMIAGRRAVKRHKFYLLHQVNEVLGG